MPTRDVLVPKMGMGSSDVDVIAVLVEVGDAVEAAAPLVEIESEKATFVIEADIAGKVTEILVAVGDIIEVGSVVCRIEADGLREGSG
jgi:pyruvate/2-oxoglutarate dehydrogenase complex dihydrolipoamide acyltransferase (E2) component